MSLNAEIAKRNEGGRQSIDKRDESSSFSPLTRAISPLSFSDMLWDTAGFPAMNRAMDFLIDTTTNSRNIPLAMDIKETTNEFVCHIDVPGVKKKDLHIEIENHMLTIIAERYEVKKDEEKQGDFTFRKVERFHGVQSRRLSLPADIVDEDSIETKYDHGVLTIHIPKKKGDVLNQNKKKIEVN